MGSKMLCRRIRADIGNPAKGRHQIAQYFAFHPRLQCGNRGHPDGECLDLGDDCFFGGVGVLHPCPHQIAKGFRRGIGRDDLVEFILHLGQIAFDQRGNDRVFRREIAVKIAGTHPRCLRQILHRRAFKALGGKHPLDAVKDLGGARLCWPGDGGKWHGKGGPNRRVICAPAYENERSFIKGDRRNLTRRPSNGGRSGQRRRYSHRLARK